MTPEELARRKQRAEQEPLVISKTDEGFRVYAATNRNGVYHVTGIPDDPACTCPDFEHHSYDPEWRCKHILAVTNLVTRGEEAASDDYDEEERQAIREEASFGEAMEPAGSGTQMLIKRSVSPDGKIDALSVEFSCPVEVGKSAALQADKILALQDQIAGRFLRAKNGDPSESSTDDSHPDDAVEATILDVGSAETRFGRRLFLRFQANGKTFRRYGSWKTLAELVTNAGYPDQAENLREGTRIGLPCRVVTLPTEDGRYVNVVRVLPAGRPAGRA